MQSTTLSNTQVKRRVPYEMVVHNQADLDAAFTDMEHLLAQQRDVPVKCNDVCVGCGGYHFVYNGPGSGCPGSRICHDCGIVEAGNIYWETMYGRDVTLKSSNYKRIHHWHERISQLLLHESTIPPDKMLQIGQKLCDGTYQVINKDTVRAVLRSLKMQLYIEKWLQIIFRLTGITPPIPGPLLIQQLDEHFQELQQPFSAHHTPGRKNFLNYNYVLCRLFQKLKCPQFCMFFPLIKSKAKLKTLDNMWTAMVSSLKWPITPMEYVAPFAVRLEQPDVLLQRLSSRCAMQALVVIERVPWRMEFRKWDHRPLKIQKRSPKRPRLDPHEQEFQKLGLLRRRLL